nr:MAG: hypothetical protein [Skomarfal virus 51]
MPRFFKKARANFGMPKRRGVFRRRKIAKKTRKMMKKKRSPTTGAAVHETTMINLGFIQPGFNINHPAAPVTTGTWSTVNCVPGNIRELGARQAIYQKFKIQKIKYIFEREKAKVPQAIASISFEGGNYACAFPDQYNALMPSPNSTNTTAIVNWAMQQPRKKIIKVDQDRFSMTVVPRVINSLEFENPSTTTAPPVSVVRVQKKMPWMDLSSDLLDTLSLGQVQLFFPAINVMTQNALSTAASTPGLNTSDIQQMYRYNIKAAVTWTVKQRFIARELV